MESQIQEYPFQNMTFSSDQSVATLTFDGLAQPVVLHQHGGQHQVSLGISETLGRQRLTVENEEQKVELNFPLMLALKDWLEPAL